MPPRSIPHFLNFGWLGRTTAQTDDLATDLHGQHPNCRLYSSKHETAERHPKPDAAFQRQAVVLQELLWVGLVDAM